MTWPDVVAAHIGHRAVLRDAATLECVDCSMKLLLPLRPDLAPTPQPAPFQASTEPPASAETIAAAKARALADLAHIKQRRTQA